MTSRRWPRRTAQETTLLHCLARVNAGGGRGVIDEVMGQMAAIGTRSTLKMGKIHCGTLIRPVSLARWRASTARQTGQGFGRALP